MVTVSETPDNGPIDSPLRALPVELPPHTEALRDTRHSVHCSKECRMTRISLAFSSVRHESPFPVDDHTHPLVDYTSRRAAIDGGALLSRKRGESVSSLIGTNTV